MNASWQGQGKSQSESRGTDSTTNLIRYQEALPLTLIATPLEKFVTCSLDQSVADIPDAAKKEGFDHLPVVHGDEIVGVLDVLETFGVSEFRQVNELYRPLSANMLAGSQMSVLDFLIEAEQKPFLFLVTGSGIQGLVSISDIQQLPVRAALFALVTQLEMTMADVIRAHYSEEPQWLAYLSESRRQKITEQVQLAREEKNQVDRLLYTQFCDKVQILRKTCSRFDVAPNLLKSTFRRFQRLRDDLAHANDLATTREHAVQISRLTGEILTWEKRLSTWT